MEKKDLKKLLASLGIASLISSGGMALPGNAKAASGTNQAGDTQAGKEFLQVLFLHFFLPRLMKLSQ